MNDLDHISEKLAEKLYYNGMEFPELTIEIIEHNIEMISSEDKDIITLFLEGVITKILLMKYLEGGLPEKIESI